MAGGGERKFQCLSCHAEILERLTANRGLHPALMGKGRREQQCAKCHSEHNGEDFVLIGWDGGVAEFEHRKAGYPLDGGHTGLACGRCHNPSHVLAAERRTIQVKDLKKTYLGLSRQCSSCHADVHQGQLGTNCEQCHVTGRWKDLTRFDHSAAKFPLNGAHGKVACAKCHSSVARPGAARPVVKFAGIPFAQCSACHQDPHRGAFAASCNSCHTDAAWKPARNVTNSFDHSKTKFPLLGKHDGLACQKCHKTDDFKAPVAREQCKSCHQDTHRGQFLSRADGGDCASCHTADGWKQSTYTVAAHAKSAYPLLGRHAAVACTACHKPAGQETRYKIRFEHCMDCHRDAHAGQFAGAAHQNRCESCHTVEHFQPATFTLSQHKQTRFPLEGAHGAVACSDCHSKEPARPDVVAYRFANLSCTGCHRDPHLSSSKAPGCQTCHGVQNWRGVARFDHSTTRFELTGAHRGAQCEQCHRATALALGARKIVFQNTPLACAGCHEDIHAGQFSKASGKGECSDCHITGKWKPSEFDHNAAGFQLTGAHANVACADCHKRREPVNGRMVLFYKPTAKDCTSCHGPSITN